jgi:RecB family exonuclease
MLEIIKVPKRSDISPFFSQFDAKKETWLVSDLRTKLELQNRLIERDSYFVDTTILRATDLWEIFFRREYPNKKVISRDWGKILVSHFLKKHETTLNLNQASSGTLLEMADFFLPIFSHSLGHDKFSEWLEGQAEFKERWADWYLLSRLCFNFLFNENDMALPSWYATLMNQKDLTLSSWKKSLWVDLGGQILWSEAELLRSLSRHVDVKVFCVESDWQKDYQYKMRPYSHLEAQAKTVSKPKVKESTEKKIKVHKFSGELAEIREAVAQVRTWLESGVPAREIGILAPDIEKYWPVLKNFLEQEGIPANKDTVSRLSAWPSVQEWLAGMRLKLKEIRYAHLEASYFQQDNPGISYEEFHALYSRLLTEEDLARNPKIYEIYHKELEVSGFISRDDWIVFLSRQWPQGKDTQPLMSVIEELYFRCPKSLSLQVADWFEQLESLVSRKEIKIKFADREGIHLASLLAAPSLWLQKRIFLGLSEDNLKQGGSQFLNRFEVEKLFADLGFYLENHELSAKEFELRLLANCEAQEDIYCFGAVTLSGQLQAPSGFWLKLAQQEKLETPQRTRWDDLQSAEPSLVLKSLRRFEEAEINNILERIAVDQGQKQIKNFKPLKPPALSASRVESYLDCPFKFASESLFGLRDLAEMDLSVHPRDYGNFVHDLFEQLTKDPHHKELSDEDFEKLIQELYETDYKASFHPELWPAYKKKLAQMARRFVDFEKNWRAQFPKTKTVGRERKWSFGVKLEGGQLKIEKKDDTQNLDGFLFTGKIDRIDSDGEGNLVVLDYKSGASSALNYSKWYENNKLQLLFYIWALEHDMKLNQSDESDAAEVVGAFYYVFKNMERHRGLGVREKGQHLFDVGGKAGSLTDLATKQGLVKDLEATLAEVMEKIGLGYFPPQPRDEDLCVECKWKRLCRAPHLK